MRHVLEHTAGKREEFLTVSRGGMREVTTVVHRSVVCVNLKYLSTELLFHPLELGAVCFDMD